MPCIIRGMDFPAPLPSTICAGDSLDFPVNLPDYPPVEGWTLDFRLLYRTGDPVNFSAEASSSKEFRITLSRNDTAKWKAGTAHLIAILRRDTERKVFSPSPIEITPDPETTSHLDTRTDSERALDELKACFKEYMASGQGHVQSYSINGRSMTFRSIADFKEQIALLQQEVAEDAAIAGASRRFQVRF